MTRDQAFKAMAVLFALSVIVSAALVHQRKAISERIEAQLYETGNV